MRKKPSRMSVRQKISSTAGSVAYQVIHGLAVVFIEAGLHEVQQYLALAIGARVDLRFGDVGTEDRVGDAASRCAESGAQVTAGQVFADAFGGAEEEQFVLLDRAAEAAAELIAAEIVERLAVGCGGRSGFVAGIIERPSVDAVGSGFGDDVDLAAGRAAEFGVCAAGDNLKFLDGLERNIDRGALSADLFCEETNVVVTAHQVA